MYFYNFPCIARANVRPKCLPTTAVRKNKKHENAKFDGLNNVITITIKIELMSPDLSK